MGWVLRGTDEFYGKYGIESHDDKWDFYRFILFFECERAIVEENFLDFYKNYYLKYQMHFDIGYRAAFSRLINGEIESIAHRYDKEISWEENCDLSNIIVKNSQKICGYVYENCTDKDYFEYFRQNHKSIAKII